MSEPALTASVEAPAGVSVSEPAAEDVPDAGQGAGSIASSPDLSLVIPTLNEEEGIGQCIRQATEAFAELGVDAEIIVSDSSTDGTAAVARAHGARVVHPDKAGYGYAYLYGFQEANGDIIAIGDGDTTYDFAELPLLVNRLYETEADLVLGSRLGGRIQPGAMPMLHRFVGNPLLTRFLNTFYDAGVTDAHSGLRVFRRELLEVLDLGAHGMEFASEMIMQASAAGLDIEEVPITYHKRVGEATLDTFGDGWRHLKFMLMNAPGYLFALPGLVFGIVGAAVLGLSLFGLGPVDTLVTNHAAIAGSLLLVVGYQIGVLSVFSTVVSDPIQRPEDPFTRLIRHGLTLERGVGAGTFSLALGLGLGGGLISLWGVGVVARPPVPVALLGLTAIVLGLQTIFNSFFLSVVAGSGQGGEAHRAHAGRRSKGRWPQHPEEAD